MKKGEKDRLGPCGFQFFPLFSKSQRSTNIKLGEKGEIHSAERIELMSHITSGS